jgi:hypothetical protein
MIARSRLARVALSREANAETVDGAIDILTGVGEQHKQVKDLDRELLRERDLLITALRDQKFRRLTNGTIANFAGLDDSAASRRALALGGALRTNRR